jgi:hypothetical protein
MSMLHETTMDGAIRTVVLDQLNARFCLRSVNPYELAHATAPFFPGISVAALAHIAAEEAIACGVCVLWEKTGASAPWLTPA